MKVHSFLDQPFDAEIELIDVGGTPLSGIHANSASYEDYAKLGLERVFSIDLLTYSIEKNAHGHPVIKIRSTERISDPYLEILIDLAWAKGQTYRSYTILLDPTNYNKNFTKIAGKQIYNPNDVSHPVHSGVIEKKVYSQVYREENIPSNSKESANYGPTLPNETVWQIAQRYKKPQVLLQQLILAIVGTNASAFTEGNLNGLKPGSRLYIPSAQTAIRVPPELAKLEVLAHDKAWQTRQPIEHALAPPYIDASDRII